MKRFIGAMGIVMLFAAQAAAIDSGPGGNLYFSEANTSTGQISKYLIKRLVLNTDWTLAGSEVNVDNVIVNNTYGAWTGYQRRNSLEILDPRQFGGTGTLIQPAQTDNTPGNSANYEVPWDIVAINPSGWTHTDLSDGVAQSGSRDTRYLLKAVVAPENWAGPSNGLSLATVQGIWTTNPNAFYDANNNGVINDATSEVTHLNSDGYSGAEDAEMGGDKAFYYSAGQSTSPHLVRRVWIDAAGAPHTTTFYTIGGATNPISKNCILTGLAINQSASPIVYMMAQDNDGAGHYYTSIFALRDGNADNVVDFANALDTVSKVWRSGGFGITPQNSNNANSTYGGADIEFYRNPDTGDTFLVANNWYNDWWVIELADNGMSASDGKVIKMGGDNAIWGPSGYGGFELDFNYIEGTIPEPATLLLFGTGALGVMGWMRRRRMK